MSYINLNTVGAFKSNESMIYANNNNVKYFTARVPLIAELVMNGLMFSNIKLEVGEQLSYKEGADSIRVSHEDATHYPRVIYGEPTSAANPTPLIRFQHWYPEKFAVAVNFSYKRGRLAGISFDIYKNDGLLKPWLMSKTISLKANKKSPIIGLLKKARKEGGSSVSIGDGGNELLEAWGLVKGSKRRMEVEVLKTLGITL